MLFDLGPQDPVQEKKAKRRRVEETAPAAEEKAETLRPAISMVASRPLGVIDEVYQCLDRSCQASIHDITEERDGRWLIECMFCGTGQWVRAISGHLKPSFTFHGGDYSGMRIDEVAGTARGMAYIEWAAQEHKSPTVKTACQTYLALLQTDK